MNTARLVLGSLSLSIVLFPSAASAAGVTFGVVTPNQKVRPMDMPATKPGATIKAAKNEVESFQVVLTAPGGDVTGVSLKLSKPLASGAAMIPPDDVVLFREAYYNVGTASNAEGAPGLWPDPLVPDKDEYFGETRNAFPIDVKSGESRAVWVDVFVPADATAGDYAGELEVDVAGASAGTIPIALHVGTFSLPSTSSLASEFGMGWSDPCLAHTGDNYCNDPMGGDDTANQLRALYIRSALEHRFTVSPLDFQPPIFPGDQPSFEKYLLPYIDGTGASRLMGAKVTSVVLDGGKTELMQWVAYAKSKGFMDRLVYYPVDEPGNDQGAWDNFIAEANALHAVDATARILITSTIDNAAGAGASDVVDVFVPVIDELEDRPGNMYAGNQRPKYDAWKAKSPNREVWSYQSCDEHGCGSCGDPSPDPAYSGWPNRVVDSSAVQDRAFPWHAFRLDFTGELYFDTTYQLTSAWNDDGQCAFSGSGDGTIFYAGKPSIIGGKTDIPIASIRMKMIREGMEDYEYLKLASAKDAAKAKSIADALFPHTYESAQTPDKLESARDELFAMLDMPAGPTSSSATGAGGAGPSGTSGSAMPASGAGGSAPGESSGSSGCGCHAGDSTRASAALALALVGLVAALRRRRSRA